MRSGAIVTILNNLINKSIRLNNKLYKLALKTKGK